ncbi:hypothetical protein E6O75_ATG00746 [Venturia nashicola]|uniref:Uncharacterized protein n=1 Tax=Venturia nashicola TaxID=86259 RepID=A0A4Z1PP58_9PEZI|nr:hypothetical protein E6O75_ATG00746 [Venturia nashicola]
MFTGKMGDLYANYVGTVLGLSQLSDGSLSELDGASQGTHSSRYRRVDRPLPPSPKIQETPSSPPPQYAKLSPILYQRPTQPDSLTAPNQPTPPPEEISRPNSTPFDFDFDFVTSPHNQNQTQNRHNTHTTTTKPPPNQYHALINAPTSPPSPTDQPQHQDFWSSEEGARIRISKAARVLGLSTDTGKKMGPGNRDTTSLSETRPSSSQSRNGMTSKGSKLFSVFKRGDSSKNF